jgi:GNAT superfamily N-acetyltransferase
MSAVIVIRLSGESDIPALMDIHTAAAARFAGLGLIATPNGLPEPIPVEAFENAASQNLLFAAQLENRCVGFALCSIERPDLYLDQLSVAPEASSKGAGTALLDAITAEANLRNLWGVSLSTFREVSWNAPFFAKRAFQEIPRPGLALWQLDIERAQAAIMDVNARCFMRRPALQTIEALAA